MYKEKIKKIYFGVVLFLMLITLFFIFNIFAKKKDVVMVRDNTASEVKKIKQGEVNEVVELDVDVEDVVDYGDAVTKIIVDKEQQIVNSQIFSEKYPEITDSQLTFFEDVAQGDDATIEPCIDREDEVRCRGAVAFIRADHNLCHYTYDDEQLYEIECERALVDELSYLRVNNCRDNEELSNYYGCLENIFSVYDKKVDCEAIESDESRAICKDVFLYNEAYYKYEREMCENINDERLNKYCLGSIISKMQDTDNDGLTDLDENNIYGTNYKDPDTDGDGYSDGDEVKAGYNPLGEGVLIPVN